MPRLPKHFEPEDMELSGPRVWPAAHARDTFTRFFLHRPELYYLSARKEALEIAERERRDPAGADRIRCTVVLISEWETRRGPIRQQETIRGFVHTKTKPLVKDVPEFLVQLDQFMRRTVSPEPDPYLTVQLQFSLYSGARGKRLATFQARWW